MIYLTLSTAPSLHSKNKEYRVAVREEAARLVGHRNISGSVPYETRIEIWGKFRSKKGKILRRNVDNIAKVVLDEVARALGVDDGCLDWRLTVVKHHASYERVQVTITPLRSQR